MRVLAIIPARGGSKGIPGKNIKYLGGRPLIAYTIDAARNSNLLTRSILSSDSSEIIEVGKKLQIEVPFIRPSEYAKDDTPSIEVVKHCLDFFANENVYFEAVCILQPTTPFRAKDLVDKAIQRFSSGEYDSLLSVREVPHEYNPHWVFEEEKGQLKIATGEKTIISRRQDLPKSYHRDGAIYLTRTDIILKDQSLYGNKIGYIENQSADYVNLDTLSDWQKAEEILKMRS